MISGGWSTAGERVWSPRPPRGTRMEPETAAGNAYRARVRTTLSGHESSEAILGSRQRKPSSPAVIASRHRHPSLLAVVGSRHRKLS